MRIAVAKEVEVGEHRVALIPDAIAKLVKQGLEVWVEAGAGEQAFFPNEAYEKAGAKIIYDPATLWGEADILVKVSQPKEHEVHYLRPGTTLIGFLNPLAHLAGVEWLAHRKITALAMEMIPRSTRAQSMDALSSQRSLSGYKAVLIAAAALPKYFPMLTTAAGTIAPAKVLIIGAGVAGLQAIATARRLGAIVEAYDIRPVAKEEVQSLGAKFIEIKLDEDTTASGGYAKEISADAKHKAQEILAERIKNADVVITTAQVPGKRAPVMVTEAMVSQMKPGSVIVDIAADQGGNCAGTDPGKDVVRNGVTIIGPLNLPASMPVHASQLYSKNILTLLQYLIKDGKLQWDFEDDIIGSTCITHNGEIISQRIRDAIAAENTPVPVV
jgi:H+-translocating NAD(P) transhydrogenase subunit alpha